MNEQSALMAFHIITVTQGGVLYRDRGQVVRWIDFAQCNRNWLASRTHITEADKRCVGWRNTGDLLDVEFFTQPRTRFIFISYVQRDTVLYNFTRRFGWWLPPAKSIQAPLAPGAVR